MSVEKPQLERAPPLTPPWAHGQLVKHGEKSKWHFRPPQPSSLPPLTKEKTKTRSRSASASPDREPKRRAKGAIQTCDYRKCPRNVKKNVPSCFSPSGAGGKSATSVIEAVLIDARQSGAVCPTPYLSTYHATYVIEGPISHTHVPKAYRPRHEIGNEPRSCSGPAETLQRGRSLIDYSSSSYGRSKQLQLTPAQQPIAARRLDG